MGEPFVEWFSGKLRGELLNCEIIETLLEAQVISEGFRIDDNNCRPHSPLGYVAPTKFAKRWRVHQAGFSELVDT